MGGWQKIKMDDLIDEISMGPFGSDIKVSCFVERGIPVLNGSNLFGTRLKEDSFRYVTPEKADSLKKANAYRGDVIVTHRGTLGQIVYIPQTSTQPRYVISQSQFRFRCNDKVIPEYVVNYFHSHEGQNKILANASQVGVPALARASSSFRDIEIPVPPLPTQRKIAAVLGALDDKIENNRKICANLEAQAQAIFKSWFVDFEPFGGKMPQGRKMGKLGDVGNIVGGATPSKAKTEFYTEEGIAWLTPKDLSLQQTKFVSKGEIDITEEGYKSASVRMLPKGSVLFSSRAPIGYVAIAKNELCTNQGFKSVVPFDWVGSEFVYQLLRMMTPVIEERASGSTFKEISSSGMKELPVIVPSKNVLHEFSSITLPMGESQKSLEDETRSLAAMRDALLPKLMSGEIDVEKVEVA